MSAGNAWALLALLSGDAPDWLRQSADWRLHQLLGLGSLQVEAALQRAESRSQLHRWRLLAADLPKLANEFQIVASGLSAREPGLHVPSGPADGVDAYVAAPVLKSISRRFKPQVESERPNVILRVPTHSWILDHHVAPPVVVAADLLDHREPRVARAASDLLGELVDAHRHS
jgi:hypothetical protein